MSAGCYIAEGLPRLGGNTLPAGRNNWRAGAKYCSRAGNCCRPLLLLLTAPDKKTGMA
jgi:hypothetical protein